MTSKNGKVVGVVKFFGHSADNMPVFLAIAILVALIHDPLQHRVGVMVFLPIALSVIAEVLKRTRIQI